jgi:hypothetical protein
MRRPKVEWRRREGAFLGLSRTELDSSKQTMGQHERGLIASQNINDRKLGDKRNERLKGKVGGLEKKNGRLNARVSTVGEENTKLKGLVTTMRHRMDTVKGRKGALTQRHGDTHQLENMQFVGVSKENTATLHSEFAAHTLDHSQWHRLFQRDEVVWARMIGIVGGRFCLCEEHLAPTTTGTIAYARLLLGSRGLRLRTK